ncbi:MAG TPA: EAL domain-containing protein [Clostridiales bacterium]|nr:EAL domain-containing protein [Clostridiales bacterium]
MAERIVDVFKHQLPEGFENRYIDVEVSIVEIKQSNISVDKLLQDATLALDNIDENANERICFYEDVMEKQVMRQDKIERALRAIIENEKENNNSLTLHFQPKWNLKNNCIIGFESLSRLYVEGLGHISPLEFIDIAERRLLIYDLGKQILQKSCTFLKKLNNLGFNNIKLAVNISVIQLLRDEFVKDISEIIESSGIDKSSLVLEITESVIMENFDLINEKLKQIRKAGVLISLDDFGTGFSSLSRLSELNIDYVKIDKYFINKITDNNDEKIITADIISMSHKFGLTVIAEGVEKEEQKKYLEQNNCDILQGYLIGRPLEEEGVIDFLKSI